MMEETTTTTPAEQRERVAREHADALTGTQEAVRIAIAAEEDPSYRQYLRDEVAPFVAAESAAAEEAHRRARREALDPVEAHNAGVTLHEFVLTDLARRRGLSGLEELRERLIAAGHAETATSLLEAPPSGWGDHVDKVLKLTQEEKERTARAFGETFLSPRR
jgi:hypothetical protein